MLFDFLVYYAKKWVKETLLSFVQKYEIDYAWTFEMLTVTFGESTKSRTQVQLLYNRFKENREDVKSISTANENIEAVKKITLDNREITIREVADDVGISFGSCQENFTDLLGMKREAANIVSKSVNLEQKQR